MKRFGTTLIALVMLFAACGDDDATATSAAADSSSTTAAAAATTTTAAETTTTAAATLTGPAAFIAAAVDYVGEYEGQWDNATFGSTGPLHINVQEASTEFGFVLIEVDADGNAFGAADPDPFVIEISVDGDNLHVGFSEFLGASTFQIDENGAFAVSAEPPLLNGLTLEIDGSITEGGFGGSYVIPDLASGTWSAAPTG